MNMHKLFLHMFDVSDDDVYSIEDYVRTMRDARMEFEHVGVPFTYDSFKVWFVKVYGPFPTTNSNPHSRTYDKLWKIIEGDNLDIIEDAAEKKGLV